MASTRSLKLAVIGSLAGLFSGLFGVGGGTVIVPLLIIWLAYGDREAAGTSLAAIVIIAIVGAATQASYGTVHYTDALVIGIPALGGVLAGTYVQQRVPGRGVALLFALLLLLVAIQMLAQ